MLLDLPAEFGSDVRPARVSAPERKPWAKDPSAPNATDGTRIDATLINDLLGLIRRVAEVASVAAGAGDDDMLANAIQAIVATTTHAVADLEDGDGYVRMTETERAKLAALVVNYKGSFADRDAVAAAYPTAVAGDWAAIMKPGEAASVALWDADVDEWVDSGGVPPQTASQVPFTPAGSISATDVQNAIQALDTSKQNALGFTAVPNTLEVAGGGLASGGGALTTNRTINVPAAVAADLRAGTNSSNALTAAAAYAAMAEVTITYASTVAIDFASGTDFVITLTGGIDFLAPVNTADVVGKRGRIRIVQDGTGSRVATWNAAFKWPGGTAPNLSTAASKQDFVDYEIVASGRVRLALTQDVPA